MDKLKKWILEEISIDETKASALILMFLIINGFGIYLSLSRGDYPDNMTTIVGWLIVGISGINVVDKIPGVRDKVSTFLESTKTKE